MEQQGGAAVENVKVVIRIRPIQKSESTKGEKVIVRPTANGTEVQIKTGTRDAHNYKVNECFSRDTSQEEFFLRSGMTNLLDSSMSGFRACAFAFGQTGAGKTYTVVGATYSIVPGNSDDGLIGRSVQYIFDRLGSMETPYQVRISCLEIYQEHVYDLLCNERERVSLQVREHAVHGFFLEGSRLEGCKNVKEACSIIDTAMRKRQVGSHDMNSRSSRSHCITDIYITLPSNVAMRNSIRANGGSLDNLDPNDEEISPYNSLGRMTIVDLAGSERLKSTQSTGKALQETGFINRSLYVLGKVIAGLVRTGGDRDHRDVPYRDSKLTKLLINSLGGDSRTLLISCITEASGSQAETLRTLTFSMSCARIKNRPVRFLDPQEKLIIELRDEIKRLRTENSQLRVTLMTAPSSFGARDGRSNDSVSISDISAGGGSVSSEEILMRRAISAQEQTRMIIEHSKRAAGLAPQQNNRKAMQESISLPAIAFQGQQRNTNGMILSEREMEKLFPKYRPPKKVGMMLNPKGKRSTKIKNVKPLKVHYHQASDDFEADILERDAKVNELEARLMAMESKLAQQQQQALTSGSSSSRSRFPPMPVRRSTAGLNAEGASPISNSILAGHPSPVRSIDREDSWDADQSSRVKSIRSDGFDSHIDEQYNALARKLGIGGQQSPQQYAIPKPIQVPQAGKQKLSKKSPYVAHITGDTDAAIKNMLKKPTVNLDRDLYKGKQSDQNQSPPRFMPPSPSQELLSNGKSKAPSNPKLPNISKAAAPAVPVVKLPSKEPKKESDSKAKTSDKPDKKLAPSAMVQTNKATASAAKDAEKPKDSKSKKASASTDLDDIFAMASDSDDESSKHKKKSKVGPGKPSAPTSDSKAPAAIKGTGAAKSPLLSPNSPTKNAMKDVKVAAQGITDSPKKHSIESKLNELESQLVKTRINMEDNPGDVTHDDEKKLRAFVKEVKQMRQDISGSPVAAVSTAAPAEEDEEEYHDDYENDYEEDDSLHTSNINDNSNNNNNDSPQQKTGSINDTYDELGIFNDSSDANSTFAIPTPATATKGTTAAVTIAADGEYEQDYENEYEDDTFAVGDSVGGGEVDAPPSISAAAARLPSFHDDDDGDNSVQLAVTKAIKVTSEKAILHMNDIEETTKSSHMAARVHPVLLEAKKHEEPAVLSSTSNTKPHAAKPTATVLSQNEDDEYAAEGFEDYADEFENED